MTKVRRTAVFLCKCSSFARIFKKMSLYEEIDTLNYPKSWNYLWMIWAPKIWANSKFATELLFFVIWLTFRFTEPTAVYGGMAQRQLVPFLLLPPMANAPEGVLPSKAEFIQLLWNQCHGYLTGLQGRLNWLEVPLISFWLLGFAPSSSGLQKLASQVGSINYPLALMASPPAPFAHCQIFII